MAAQPTSTRIELELGAWLDLHQVWLPPAEAAELQSALLRELCWEQRHIVLFGKRILQPRLIAWAGELPYRYSGQTLEPRPWPAALGQLPALCARVAERAAAPFNHVLVNRYRDGSDSMGFHADSEPELGTDPVVATLSLGATRRFQIRPQRAAARGERALTLPLADGSLLIMGGTCQRHYRHAVARESGAVGERISLTFRQLLRAPAG